MKIVLYFGCLIIVVLLFSFSNSESKVYNCNELLMGQYLCPDPNIDHIDDKTQQLKGCTKENKARGKHIKIKFSTLSFERMKSQFLLKFEIYFDCYSFQSKSICTFYQNTRII